MLNQEYKTYVGGPKGVERWETNGRLQFSYLLSEGLKPHHFLLDVGCGACRLAKHVIPYLSPMRYAGIDSEKWLIDAGKDYELTPTDLDKNPRFVVTADFTNPLIEIQLFHYIWAHGLLASLRHTEVEQFIQKMSKLLVPGGRLYVTYWYSPKRVPPKKLPYPPGIEWRYTPDQVKEFSQGTNLVPIPREWTIKDQRMMLFLNGV